MTIYNQLLTFSDPVISDVMDAGDGNLISWTLSEIISVQGFQGDVLMITGIPIDDGLPLHNTTPTPLLFYAYRDGLLSNLTSELNLDMASTIITRDILVADLNSDGLDDIFLSNHGTEKYTPFPGERNTLLIQNPDGTFSNQSFLLPEWTDFSHGSTIGDFNGDGHNDIYVNNLGDDDLTPSYFLINDGNGNFVQDANLNRQVDQTFNQAGFGTGYFALAVDIFSDGLDDIFLGKLYSFSGESLDGYLLNEGDRFTLAFDENFFWPGTGDGVFKYHVIDYNRNGLKDVMVFANDDNMVNDGVTVGGKLMIEVYENLGIDGFRRVTHDVIDLSPLGDTYLTGGLDVDIYDVTSNGLPDIEVRAWTQDWNSISLLFVNTGKDFSKPLIKTGHEALPRGQYGDFNGDGIVDIAYQDGNHVAVRYGQLVEGRLAGSSAGQLIMARDQNSIIQGSPLNDILKGSLQREKLIGFAGEDFLDGGGGIDTAVFFGERNEYLITLSEDAGYQLHLGQRIALPFRVEDIQVDRDGINHLANVERLEFSDVTLAFDIDGPSSAGAVYRLYQAALGRTPDKQGLGYWIDSMDNGLNLTSISNSFINSTEFKANFGSAIDNESFVYLLYNNILDREPDQAGFDYWVDVLNSGHSRHEILPGFSESEENQLNVIGDIANGFEYQLWIG